MLTVVTVIKILCLVACVYLFVFFCVGTIINVIADVMKLSDYIGTLVSDDSVKCWD